MAGHFFKQNNEMRKSYGWRSSVPFSEHFYAFLDRKMVELIKRETGLSPSTKFNISIGFPSDIPNTYEPGEISRLNFAIGVDNVILNSMSFCWRSRNGITVSIGDEEFDEANLECWVEGLQPELYHMELARCNNKKPPFKVGKLPFELEIRNYHYTMHLYVTLQDLAASEGVSKALDNSIVGFNELADARAEGKVKGPMLQGVHNWKITILPDDRLQLYIDAASPEILKKITQELTNFKDVTKVEMDLPE